MIDPATFETALRALLRDAAEDSSAEPGLESPRNRAHGDLASSVAMPLASRRKQKPLDIAEAIAQRFREILPASPLQGAIEKVEVKPPGFINFFLSRSFLHSVLRSVFSQDRKYGSSALGAGRKVMVEFVSANPTGPLSVAHGRQAAVGDALANLLAFAGYSVHREYYLNDEGTQIDLLGESVLARAKEALGFPAVFPENGYKGEYVRELGKRFSERCDAKEVQDPKFDACWKEEARRFGAGELTRVIRGELDAFGVKFDEWFPQSSLDEGNYLKQTLEELKKTGHLYESEGAWWLKSTAFGDDKDRVVIRSDGRLTYIAADIAYHRKKFGRGYQLLVNLWGPDHHGYIPRLKAAMQALGFPADAVQVRIVQLCTLKRGAETIPMSTREGQFITLTQVMTEVGHDAARFFFLLRKMDAHLEFDLELAKKNSMENPVYYIQYAHARIVNILANARKEGIPIPEPGRADHALLTAPEELALLGILRRFPCVVEACAKSLEPFGLTSYLQELAEGLHRFYDAHRVIGVGHDLAGARLDLVRAVQIALANGLRLLGVSAPEKM